jgi:hypothetical protein
MKLKTSITILSLSLGLTVGATTTIAAPSGWYQYGDRDGDRYRDRGDRYGDIRGLVERTQSDLQAASEMQRGDGDQRSRYRNAERHLSTFDRHLEKGHFDKGELDPAISDIQHILDKNTLEPSARDALFRDISDLRAMREHRY